VRHQMTLRIVLIIAAVLLGASVLFALIQR
jgi:hypothetical protein